MSHRGRHEGGTGIPLPGCVRFVPGHRIGFFFEYVSALPCLMVCALPNFRNRICVSRAFRVVSILRECDSLLVRRSFWVRKHHTPCCVFRGWCEELWPGAWPMAQPDSEDLRRRTNFAPGRGDSPEPSRTSKSIPDNLSASNREVTRGRRVSTMLQKGETMANLLQKGGDNLDKLSAAMGQMGNQMGNIGFAAAHLRTKDIVHGERWLSACSCGGKHALPFLHASPRRP